MLMHELKSALLILTLISLGAGLQADDKESPLRSDHPERYVVQKGDTLWGISGKFLRDPWMWPNIWQANPQVQNPHLIYPGDTIGLIYVDGKPQLRIDRGRPLVKLSPQGRESPIKQAIPVIPSEAIRPFLSKHRIVSKNELEQAPYVVAAVGERVVTGAGDKIYVQGHKSIDHQNFMLVRSGDTYLDPLTKEVLGFEALYVGDTKLQRHGDPATHFIRSTSREVLIGDRVLPAADDSYRDNFVPRAPSKALQGHIIAVMEGVRQIGQHQVVVINRGTRDGLDVGHILAVYQIGKTIVDPVANEKSKRKNKSKKTVQLPDERAGILMVFRTFEKLSYALVMSATTNMTVMDVVKNP